MAHPFRPAAALVLCSCAVALAACSSGSNDDAGPMQVSPTADGASAVDAAVDSTMPTADAAGPADATTGPDAGSDAPSGAAPIDAAEDASEGASDDSGVTGCALDPSGEATELRCTGLYSDWRSRAVAPGVTEFDPGLHLWSDGAIKTRWVYLPPGQKIDTSNLDEWTFPVGTKFWKQFIVDGVLIETRLLRGGTWRPQTFTRCRTDSRRATSDRAASTTG